MRTVLAVMTATLITAACADAPSPASPVAAAAPVARSTPAPTAAPATTTDGNKVSTDLIKKAASVGYFPRTRKGVAVFCRKDADIGTRIPTEKCIGEDQLAENVARLIEARENLSKGEMCSSPRCGN